MAKYNIRKITFEFDDLWVEAESANDAHTLFETEYLDRIEDASYSTQVDIDIADENRHPVESEYEPDVHFSPRLTRLATDKYGNPVN